MRQAQESDYPAQVSTWISTLQG